LMKHLNKTPANARFGLCAVSSDFDLLVFVLWISQSARAIEGKAGRRDPFDLERLSPIL
jgi:hypothetical protein